MTAAREGLPLLRVLVAAGTLLWRSLSKTYSRTRQLASHWGALQLIMTGGGLALFVGLPGTLSVVSSVHPLVAVFSTLGGVALLSVTAVAFIAVRSMLSSGMELPLPWVRPAPAPGWRAVLSEDVRWREDGADGVLAECPEHEVELMYRRFRLGLRGRGDGRVEPVHDEHQFGRKGTLYCPAPRREHRLAVPDSASYGEAKRRALVLIRAQRRRAAAGWPF